MLHHHFKGKHVPQTDVVVTNTMFCIVSSLSTPMVCTLSHRDCFLYNGPNALSNTKKDINLDLETTRQSTLIQGMRVPQF